MTERPILFSGSMVRAILVGRKTQTRRVAKEFAGDIDGVLRHHPNQNGCRYGQPGDRLWVRETWRRWPDGIAYRADYHDQELADYVHGPWKPSIHMRRADSRILLEIVAVRVERLNDISEEDAMAEGFYQSVRESESGVGQDVVGWYRGLWEQINGAGSWAANPWVWVVAFNRVTPCS